MTVDAVENGGTHGGRGGFPDGLSASGSVIDDTSNSRLAKSSARLDQYYLSILKAHLILGFRP